MTSSNSNWLNNLKIGAKLTLGFGLMVVLLLILAATSLYASSTATTSINSTNTVRVPQALEASRAQASLLRIIGSVQAYLALGDPEHRTTYTAARQDFEGHLAQLEAVSGASDSRLAELKATYAQWTPYPEQLFDLHDDQLEREPALKILLTDMVQYVAPILSSSQTMLDSQTRAAPSAESVELLQAMADFRFSFAQMVSGLRGYVTTGRQTFKFEYDSNLGVNKTAWEKLTENRAKLSTNQQASLDVVAQNRELFLQLPDTMFSIVESPDRFKDQSIFRNEALPLADKMLVLLGDITTQQQDLLRSELDTGRQGLETAQRQTFIGSIVALALGLALAFVFRQNIAGPIRRLTGVAEIIRSGNLTAQAQVESGDEIGTLALTFNGMTNQLRQTLTQVRKEKKRADDLLNVVIPIGIELSSEKDFNRLLEKMLVEAQTFCNANAGALCLVTENNELKFVLARDTRQNWVFGGTSDKPVPFAPVPLTDVSGKPNDRNMAVRAALSAQTINLSQADAAYDFSAFASADGTVSLAATSWLSIPLKNSLGKSLGVLQLLDPYDRESNTVVPFDANLQQMMESFSSLAVAALEAYIREQALRQEIQQLRIEIDESKRQKQVSEIVDTEVFRDLQAKVKEMRARKSSGGKGSSATLGGGTIAGGTVGGGTPAA